MDRKHVLATVSVVLFILLALLLTRGAIASDETTEGYAPATEAVCPHDGLPT